MRFLPGLKATALVATLCLLGCGEADLMESFDEPWLEPAGGDASGGTNGCTDIAWLMRHQDVVDATHASLVNAGTMKVSDEIASTLLAEAFGPTGPVIFSYVVQCGLERGNTVTWASSGGNKDFVGLGHLSTTADWLTGPLDDSAREDLMACVMALVNPLGLHVPLLFSGPNVSDDGKEYTDFDVEEALWRADMDSSGTMTYTAWPLKPFADLCEANPGEALKQRVCGQNPQKCNLEIGEPTECAYDEKSEGYYCNGKPALMTTLRKSDVVELHPVCVR